MKTQITFIICLIISNNIVTTSEDEPRLINRKVNSSDLNELRKLDSEISGSYITVFYSRDCIYDSDKGFLMDIDSRQNIKSMLYLYFNKDKNWNEIEPLSKAKDSPFRFSTPCINLQMYLPETTESLASFFLQIMTLKLKILLKYILICINLKLKICQICLKDVLHYN